MDTANVIMRQIEIERAKNRTEAFTRRRVADLQNSPEVATLFAGVSERARPTRMMWMAWRYMVVPELGLTAEGRVHGICPMHPLVEGQRTNALYDFRGNFLICQGDPCCHEGRKMITIAEASAIGCAQANGVFTSLPQHCAEMAASRKTRPNAHDASA